MQFTRLLRHTAASPLRAMLDIPDVRRRVIFDLKQRYFDELEIEVPLGFGLKAPITSQEFWVSFEEIFFEREYKLLLENVITEKYFPQRWLDLGCHAGYFSLWLAYERIKSGLTINDCRVLLIDPDPNVADQVRKLITTNRLESSFQFLPVAISKDSGQTKFAVRSFMSSSLAELRDEKADIHSVKSVNTKELISYMSPPYDLIKVDIEGAEFDFMTAYEEIFKSAKHVILEWHSWHTGGGGRQQLHELALANNFRVLSEFTSPRTITIKGKPETCGMFLLENKT
ncbi:MAG: FkbM family methyltransferase [Candidatus Obscuribacterales bacterium]|nr:FkbM family methyltransferase [Candidatus Obscuribacterales bacterium]